MSERGKSPEFHELMKQLLQFMQIPSSRLSVNEVYLFTINGETEISFLQQRPGSIDMLVHAATLANPKADNILRSLLEMNLFAYDGPNISVGMNAKTGAISLWSRLSLADMDVRGLVELVDLAVKRASAVRESLLVQRVPLAGDGAGRKQIHFRSSQALF
jgi:hypothetical protein